MPEGSLLPGFLFLSLWPAVKIPSLTHVWETDLASWKTCFVWQHCEDLECLVFITFQMRHCKNQEASHPSSTVLILEKWKQIKLGARVRLEEISYLLYSWHFHFIIMLWNVRTARTELTVLAHHGNTQNEWKLTPVSMQVQWWGISIMQSWSFTLRLFTFMIKNRYAFVE